MALKFILKYKNLHNCWLICWLNPGKFAIAFYEKIALLQAKKQVIKLAISYSKLI
jgi:hypothetical protein